MTSASRALGLVLVALSALAWSLAGLFTRVIPLDSWTILAWRGIFAALGLALVVAIMERGRTLRVFLDMGAAGWSFVAVSGLGTVFFITSLKETTVAHVAVVYATIPFVAALLAWLALGERPRRNAIIASTTALIGIVIMIGINNEGTIHGDLLAFGMTLCMAVLMVIVRRSPDIAIMPAACISALASALVCWPIAAAPLSVAGPDLLMLALFGLLVSAVGLAFFTLGARLLPPVETALLGSLDAPLAPLWIWLFFSEMPGGSTIAGGTVVFAAVLAYVAAEAARADPVLAQRQEPSTE
jgi:drug/metabolite transporter (DMT)-like permease